MPLVRYDRDDWPYCHNDLWLYDIVGKFIIIMLLVIFLRHEVNRLFGLLLKKASIKT